MQKTFIRYNSEYGVLYFSTSGENSYAVTPFGVIVASTHEVESDVLAKDVTATIVCNGVSVNKFTLRLQDKSEVRLYAKHEALRVPEALGGFKFGKQVFRTVTVPTSEVPIYEVPFEAQCEALVGLA